MLRMWNQRINHAEHDGWLYILYNILVYRKGLAKDDTASKKSLYSKNWIGQAEAAFQTWASIWPQHG